MIQFRYVFKTCSQHRFCRSKYKLGSYNLPKKLLRPKTCFIFIPQSIIGHLDFIEIMFNQTKGLL